MGKMTDALRRAKQLKEQKDGRAPAASAPASAPIEDFVAPPMPATPKPEARPISPASVAAAKPAPPRVAPPKPAPAPILPKIEPPRPEPISEPVVAGTPASQQFGIIEDEPGESVDVEVPELGSLPIIEETSVEAPEAAVTRPEVVEAPPTRAPEPERVVSKPLVFETVEEAPPAPAPIVTPEPFIAPIPAAERAPEPVIEPIAAKAPVVEPEPSSFAEATEDKVAPVVEFEPVEIEPAPPVVVIAPAPKVEKPAPEPTPVSAPKLEPKPAPRPEPKPAVAWPPVEEKDLGQSQTAGQSQISGTVPKAPALPAVEPTPKPSRVPYLSVHYGRDERMTDEFRRLKNRLTEEGPARLILVVSPRALEGKTTVALNLASSFANAFGEKVVVVDGNVPRPKIGEVLEVGADAPGLVRAVRGRASADEAAVQTAVGGLYAVTVPANRDERVEGLLDSDGMKSLLASLRKRFTRIVVELPASEDRAEGLSLAAQADVVLVPVMRTRSRRKSVRRLVEMLKDRGASRVRCVFIEA